jgi:hypothetical protein
MVVLVGLLAAAPGEHLDADALERNRLLLEKWRADPEHSARLQQDLRAFYQLPLAKQEQMRRFDRELHETTPETQARLWAVLDRYRVWLERLPEEQRQQILNASTPNEKMQLIREVRQQQWIDRLPAKMRDEVRKLPANLRSERVSEMRRQERVQRLAWMKASPPVRERVREPGPVVEPSPAQAAAPAKHPKRLVEFPAEVQQFVAELLTPRLSSAEKERLQRADGNWPELARTIRELSDRHPVLPPLPTGPITDYKHLPAMIQIKVSRQRIGKKGKWPDYALAAVEAFKKTGKKPPPPLGASRLDEFPEEVRTFVRQKLLPVLGPQLKESLRKLEGHWPEYPKRLLDLARQKHLVIPGMSLPGPRTLWEAARPVGRIANPSNAASLAFRAQPRPFPSGSNSTASRVAN